MSSLFSSQIAALLQMKTPEQEVVEALREAREPLTFSDIKVRVSTHALSLTRLLDSLLTRRVIERASDVDAPAGSPRKKVATYRLCAGADLSTFSVSN